MIRGRHWQKRLGAEWTHLPNARTVSAAKRREITERPSNPPTHTLPFPQSQIYNPICSNHLTPAPPETIPAEVYSSSEDEFNANQ